MPKMYPTRYSDPEAVGYLVARYVRCGKPNCRCRSGPGHGPYWYLVWRERDGGRWRQRKRYVQRDQVAEVRRKLAEAKARDRAMMDLLRQSRRLRGAVNRRLRGEITDEQLREICHIAQAGQVNVAQQQVILSEAGGGTRQDADSNSEVDVMDTDTQESKDA